MSIAQRRHHRERLMRKRRHYWGRDMLSERKRLGQCVTTPATCSCPVCGNDRQYLGLTIQEQRVMQESLLASVEIIHEGEPA